MMSLFQFGKKKKAETTASGSCSAADNGKIYSIKVLGTGCKSCHDQYENTKQAIKKIGPSVEVEYITDIQKIMEYSVMSMPALVVNEKVVSTGKVLKSNDVLSLLDKLRENQR